jgi:branched-chain amino acid transport system substrate-binding protein
MQKRQFMRHVVAAWGAVLCLASAGHAAETVKIANIFELSGTGAAAGASMKNGVDLAIREINAAGGILGRKIETITLDTQTNPTVAKAMAKKAVDQDVFAVFGPVFSGSILVSMAETQRAEVPNFTGGEAANITQQGNPYIFRTSFTQAAAIPKIARYMAKIAKIKNLAIIYVNNDFGKGGRDVLLKSLPAGMTVVADVSTDPGQADFSAAVQKARQANPDGIFVYSNEEESARILRELRKQGWTRQVIGETTLVGQKTIELAGPAANGALAHVGLTVDAPNPPVRAFKSKYENEYHALPDHNSLKGYTGMYSLKAAIEKVGKLDRKAVAGALHGLKLKAADHPGVLMDMEYDAKGDLNRESFMVEVKDGKQEVVLVLPPVSSN